MIPYTGSNDFAEFFAYLNAQAGKQKYRPAAPERMQALAAPAQPFRLPRAYLDFMRYAGGGAFWVGSDYGFDKVPLLNQWGAELLAENHVPLLLKPDDFVFLMHQGYRFCFFSLSAGDDPPVFCFSEEYDKPEFVRLSDSFTDFIIRPYRPIHRHAE
ncbi:MAG: SMI1/KNR4 family protein [Oscillospiraceae bacterium]|nr:SMI1/KNR4 family protein [Oscillospiraceae bacterium]